MTFTKQAQLARANASKKSRIGSSKVDSLLLVTVYRYMD
jgi:hypothetical protein